MKAYFTGSIVGKKQYLSNYEKILDVLHQKNIDVKADHIINHEENHIVMETKEKRLAFHKKLEKWIREADFMIVESSFPSISVGFEISLALQLGKPVLILYYDGNPPSLLADYKSDKLLCEKYTFQNVADIIDDFCNFIDGSMDSRFTFFTPPDIAHYLEKRSHEEKMPKSVYLRNLILQDMTLHK